MMRSPIHGKQAFYAADIVSQRETIPKQALAQAEALRVKIANTDFSSAEVLEVYEVFAILQGNAVNAKLLINETSSLNTPILHDLDFSFKQIGEQRGEFILRGKKAGEKECIDMRDAKHYMLSVLHLIEGKCLHLIDLENQAKKAVEASKTSEAPTDDSNEAATNESIVLRPNRAPSLDDAKKFNKLSADFLNTLNTDGPYTSYIKGDLDNAFARAKKVVSGIRTLASEARLAGFIVTEPILDPRFGIIIDPAGASSGIGKILITDDNDEIELSEQVLAVLDGIEDQTQRIIAKAEMALAAN